MYIGKLVAMQFRGFVAVKQMKRIENSKCEIWKQKIYSMVSLQILYQFIITLVKAGMNMLCVK